MAFFGRKPQKGAAAGVSAASAAAARPQGQSEGLKRLQEEEAQRERFAKEFEERHSKTPAEEDEVKERRVQAAAPAAKPPRPRVFLDVEVRGPELLGRPGKVEASGRIEFELFADVVPKTAENFRCLCTGERGSDLTFDQCRFHRIIPGFMAQGGDFTDGDGTGGRSIYGRTFADENFSKAHDARGALSMANSGPHTNGSQFFILFGPAPHLNRKHVVFGRLVREEGQLLRRMEDRGTKGGDVKGSVRIVNCGELRTSSGGASGDASGARKRDRGRRRGKGSQGSSADSASDRSPSRRGRRRRY